MPPQGGRTRYTSHGLPHTEIRQTAKMNRYVEERGSGDPFVTSGVARERPEQLQMFMTPREIMSRYRPLEGDRYENSEGESWYDRQYLTGTNASRNQFGNENYSNPRSGTEHNYVRSSAGRRESDEELWERKEEEAYDAYGYQGKYGNPFSESQATIEPHSTFRTRDTQDKTLPKGRVTEAAYHVVKRDTQGEIKGYTWEHEREQKYEHPGRQGLWGGTESLGEALETHGFNWEQHTSGPRAGTPKYGISLQFQHEGLGEVESQRSRYNNPDIEDKPQILGGHHRMAVMRKIGPDTPLPVMYFRNLAHAQSTKGYK